MIFDWLKGLFPSARSRRAQAMRKDWTEMPRPTLSTLSAQVTRALQLDDADPGRHDRATLRARLRSRISQDFAEGKVTVVDGWMLSLVEAQACAIAHLSATGVA